MKSHPFASTYSVASSQAESLRNARAREHNPGTRILQDPPAGSRRRLRTCPEAPHARLRSSSATPGLQELVEERDDETEERSTLDQGGQNDGGGLDGSGGFGLTGDTLD